MKVSGGLVSITQNPRARAKFFLITPELSRLAEQAKEIAGVSIKIQDQHHNLSLAVLSCEEINFSKLTATIASYTNPFTQPEYSLFNLVTEVVMPEEVKRDLCAQSTEGAKLLRAFVTERIQKENENLWSPMKKRSLRTWKSTSKKTNITVNLEGCGVSERPLFVCSHDGRVSKSRPEFNQQEAIGTFEFSLVPRSLFAADGTMFHCST